MPIAIFFIYYKIYNLFYINNGNNNNNSINNNTTNNNKNNNKKIRSEINYSKRFPIETVFGSDFSNMVGYYKKIYTNNF